ncbi:MAG: hypothetical protein ACRC0L_01800, partial [Angustibacter sp.]
MTQDSDLEDPSSGRPDVRPEPELDAQAEAHLGTRVDVKLDGAQPDVGDAEESSSDSDREMEDASAQRLTDSRTRPDVEMDDGELHVGSYEESSDDDAQNKTDAYEPEASGSEVGSSDAAAGVDARSEMAGELDGLQLTYVRSAMRRIGLADSSAEAAQRAFERWRELSGDRRLPYVRRLASEVADVAATGDLARL